MRVQPSEVTQSTISIQQDENRKRDFTEYTVNSTVSTDELETLRRCSTLERKAPTRFTINACVPQRDEDEPTMREELKSEESKEWKNSFSEEIRKLEDMDCWTIMVKNPD